MTREVSAHITGQVGDGTRLVFAVAAVDNAGYDRFEEDLRITVDGRQLDVTEIRESHGGRLHTVTAPDSGEVVLDYRARIEGRSTVEPVRELELIEYLRPSRYCESDTLMPTAVAEFAQLRGTELLDAVTRFVHRELAYVSGWSRPTDGAVSTLLSRRGVCRDFAHLAIALLRARNVPARLVAVYAPGLTPMDFHAVAEAFVDGSWYLLDATRMAQRHQVVRISTGRDAADTAFLTAIDGPFTFGQLAVTATADGDWPADTGAADVVIG
ncbi:putative transglutaminase-like protein [Tersicoccus solisilvae]|uniref:Transglutaminase-like protein n=1 Tax=Tersicoccus solisilvae TaxID=1882339 RepID=A0ABQ1PK33_9MICC|nr:transglutaminase family protein [Tersicoccus solisilvae]GGC98398.1 putative transglutaminase-like protein [Tersicoccus solisilvae]